MCKWSSSARRSSFFLQKICNETKEFAACFECLLPFKIKSNLTFFADFAACTAPFFLGKKKTHFNQDFVSQKKIDPKDLFRWRWKMAFFRQLIGSIYFPNDAHLLIAIVLISYIPSIKSFRCENWQFFAISCYLIGTLKPRRFFLRMTAIDQRSPHSCPTWFLSPGNKKVSEKVELIDTTIEFFEVPWGSKSRLRRKLPGNNFSSRGGPKN